MKTSIIALTLLICASLFFPEQETLKINLEKSTVTWTGSMLFGFGAHIGTVKFNSGILITKERRLTGGNFVVDLNTMTNTDGAYNKELIDHLKNEDFFDLKRYPTATLVFTEVGETKRATYFNITANLTIRGITKPVFFQAEVDIAKGKFNTKFKIDRTEFDIVYGTKGNVEVKD